MIYAATILALFRDIEITTQILSQYPPLCQQKRKLGDKKECEKSLPEIFSTGVARDQLNIMIENACSWAVEHALGDCVPNQEKFQKYSLNGKYQGFLELYKISTTV